MNVKQISVFLENKPGTLCALTEILAKNNIDMRALSLAEASDFGIARMIVNDVYAATTILREEGLVHSVSPVLGVAIPDEPGGLSHVLNVLDKDGINVEYMYAFLGGKSAEHAYMIFRVADIDAAKALLKAEGIAVIAQEEIAKL